MRKYFSAYFWKQYPWHELPSMLYIYIEIKISGYLNTEKRLNIKTN